MTWSKATYFALVVCATIALSTTAQAEAECDFVAKLDYTQRPSEVTESFRNCLRADHTVRVESSGLKEANLHSLGFDAAQPISIEIAGRPSPRPLEIDEFSSRMLSRLIVERICTRLTHSLKKLSMRCPFPGFFDISIDDILNMFFASSPRAMNFSYIAAPLTIAGKTGEISANSMSNGDWLVIRRLELRGIETSRIDFENIVIMEDLFISNSTIEKIFWENIFVLGDTTFRDSQIGFLSVDGLAGAGSLRIDNLSGEDTYLRRMSFNRVEISHLQYEMSEWQLEALRKLSKDGFYRD